VVPNLVIRGDGATQAWIQQPGAATRWARAPQFDPPFAHRFVGQEEGACDNGDRNQAWPYLLEQCPASRTRDNGVRAADRLVLVRGQPDHDGE
jgi:hypothetical protein